MCDKTGILQYIVIFVGWHWKHVNLSVYFDVIIFDKRQNNSSEFSQ